MAEYIDKELDHGKEFLNPYFHKLLHYVKDIAEEKGRESFDYEQAMIKIARIMGAWEDTRGLAQHELYHYIMGEHKTDIRNAIEFITHSQRMQPQGDYHNEEYPWMPQVFLPQNLYNHMGGGGNERPWMAEGYSSKSEDYSYNNGHTRNSAWPMDYSRMSRPDADVYIEERPYNFEDDPSMKERYMANAYMRMLFQKEDKEKAIKQAKDMAQDW